MFCKFRAKFESLCGSLFNNCIELVNDVLTSCQMNDANIDKVAFVVFNVVVKGVAIVGLIIFECLILVLLKKIS